MNNLYDNTKEYLLDLYLTGYDRQHEQWPDTAVNPMPAGSQEWVHFQRGIFDAYLECNTVYESEYHINQDY